MEADRILILGLSVQDEGMEFILADAAEKRQGLMVAHSYFVEFGNEMFGSRLRDVLSEFQELVEDVHLGWKRVPKDREP